MNKYLRPTTYYNYIRYHAFGKRKTSYSQCGEDIILSYVLKRLGITKPYYLDIGAHDPIMLSNTYYFYKKGCRGICVDPNPHYTSLYRRKRPRDQFVQVGISSEPSENIPFYVMSSAPHSTFSKKDADHYVQFGNQKIRSVINTQIKTAQSVIHDYANDKINLVSIDVEGLDFEVIKSFDFSNYRPEVFCIETIEFDGAKSEHKSKDIIAYMHSKDYIVYADTHLNTIFVDKKSWEARKV